MLFYNWYLIYVIFKKIVSLLFVNVLFICILIFFKNYLILDSLKIDFKKYKKNYLFDIKLENEFKMNLICFMKCIYIKYF